MNRLVGRFLTPVVLLATGCSPRDVEPAVGRADYAPARFSDPNRVERLKAALPEIDSLFRTFARENRVPGIAYGIIVDGKLVHTGTYGLRNTSNNAPVDSASVFRIASMTKSFTALSILKLRDEGKLSLDDPADEDGRQLEDDRPHER